MDDYAWLEELHRMHYDELLRLARNRLYPVGTTVIDAEDIVQQAFLLATEKDVSDHGAPLWWLMKTIDHLSRRSKIKVFTEASKQQRLIRQYLDNSADRTLHALASTEDETCEREMLLLAEQVLEPAEWALLQQYCLNRIPPEELALQHGVEVNALRVRIFRLRKKLRAAFYGV